MLVWRKNWLSNSVSNESRDTLNATQPRRSRWTGAGWACLIAAAGLAVGCKTADGERELKYIGKDRDLQYYREVSTKIDYPDVAQESPQEVTEAVEPRRLKNLTKDQIYDVGLDEVLRASLQNSEIIRDNASFLSPGNRLLNNPDFTSSVHDIAIQDTNTLFGQGGVEAALAEFDANFTTSMYWGRTEQVSESRTIGYQAFAGQTEEFGDFRSQLSKIMGDGSSLTLAHNWFYSGQNQDPNQGGRPFPSEFTSRPGRGQDLGLPTVSAEWRTPFWAGAGREYTSIAGPISRRPTLQSTPNVNQGVAIARIRTDMSIADFEEAVANLLKDVEESYWDLALSYRTYDAEMQSQTSALQTWREVRANMEAGKVGAADEAQARDNYYEITSRAKSALGSLYQAELRLRRLMGLPVNDGRIMRPSEDPITAEYGTQWHVALTEALTMRPELRKQKWNIKSLELQYEASQSLIRPRLDFVARYEVNGFGDKLFGNNSPGSPFNSAYRSLLAGDYTGWALGFEFSMPIGFRGAHSQVKNYEHRLAKARSVLASQEIEVSHELAATFQQVDQAYATAKTNFNRRRAAERRVQAFEAEYKVGRTTLDQLLRSQISLSQAEISYFQSLITYNKSLTDLKFRKGTILRDDQVYLSEGMWDAEAYGQALEKAWSRSYAIDAPLKATQPEEFAIDGDDVVLSAQPAQWPVHAEPLPNPGIPEVPAPNGDKTPKPAAPKVDNRSAEAQNDGVGSLRDSNDDSFLPPTKSGGNDDPISPQSLPLGPLPSPQGQGVIPMPPEVQKSDETSFVPPTKSKSENTGFEGDLFAEPLSSSYPSRKPLVNPTRRALQANSEEFMQPLRAPARPSGAIQQTGARASKASDAIDQAEFIAPARR